MYYQIGQSIELVCIDSWSIFNGDYQILAYTQIDDIKLMGISILELFKERHEEKLFDQLYEEGRMFYILKKIDRINFEYEDKDKIDDDVKEYTYICDDLIDYNRTVILTKRSKLSASIHVGTFFSEKINNKDIEITGYHKDIKNNLKDDLNNLLSNYSDSFIITLEDGDTILQPLDSALSDDSSFLEKRKQAEQDALEKELKEKEKQEYLINKENQLLNRERELNILKESLVNSQKDIDKQLVDIQKEKQSLLSSQNAVDKYESYLAQKEAKLNLRAEKITERENELGISNSNL